MSRYDEMRDQCIGFHKENPEVMRLFSKYTRQLLGRGFANYSARGVFQRIRWETDQADYDGKSTFKINDHYSPFYARAWMRMNPQHDGFFRLRTQISKDIDATGLSPLGPKDFK
jgi:hypothetical protein